MAPIYSLPPEILREIFLYFQPERSLRARFPKGVVRLSTVSQRWRSIIFNTSLLWTQVVCNVPNSCDNNEQHLTEYLSWLEIYLKRSGSLPLDVSLGGKMQTELFQFLIKNAPFHRWRSLTLYYPAPPSQSMSLTGEFSSLISLSCRGFSIDDCPLLPIINQSANQLRQLHVSSHDAQFMMKLYPSIMGRISALTTADDMDSNLHLPSNITKIHVKTLPLHPSPHIVSLTTGILSLDSFDPSRILNLRELEVTATLHGLSRIPITIHSLRCLILRTRYVPALDLIRAPSLESLQICPHYAGGYNWLREAFSSPLYDLSPVDFILEADIDQNFVILILSKSPRVETLTLQLMDKEPCEWLVAALSERTIGGEQDDQADAWKLCPHLITLRIKLTQNQKNTEVWKAYLLRILHGRNGSVLRSITCEWEDGNETTVLA
jgi:hypothetical protein